MANIHGSNSKKPLWMWSIWRLLSCEHFMEKLWIWISSIQERNRENTAREFTLGFRIAPSMVMFLGSRLKKSRHKWEVARENKRAHKKSIFYSVTRILHSKAQMQAANLAWGGCIRKRKGTVCLCSNKVQEIKSGGRNREASGLVWTRRALRVRTSVTIEKLRWQKLSCIVKETVKSLKKPEC